mgnify:CR=1 FL=1
MRQNGGGLWIILGICVSVNTLFANCTPSGSNDLKCDSVTKDSDSYTYTLTENKNLNGNLTVSGGNLTLIFAPNVTKLTTTIGIEIKGGTMSVNCEDDGKGNCKDSRASFTIDKQQSSGISISGGIFKSAFVVNKGYTTSGGINISGGTFTAGMLQNGDSSSHQSANLELTSGNLNVKMLENYDSATFSGGTSTITTLINNASGANLTISNGTHTIGTLSNEKGTATISGGTNTIQTLSNNANLTISGGTKNEITHFYNSGTATISGGNDNKITNLRNSANLKIENGTNQITTFSNEKGEATISGGTNNITNLLNTATLTLQGNGTAIKKHFENRSGGTLDLKTSAKLTLDLNANLYNYGTISGSGTISGGVFNHYGKFNNFSGTFSDLTFNNMSNLTIKNSGSSGDLASLNVKSFANYYYDKNSKLTLESTLTTQGFTNGILANFTINNGGNLTINAGGTQTITCDNNSTSCPCTNSQKTCTINLVAQNAGGFFTLENGGKVNSKIDFGNTGYLIIDGGDSGEFNVNHKSLKNEGNGEIQLKSGTIKGSVQNISGNFNMSGGTIENTLKNNGNFTLSGGEIKGNIDNEGGTFAIRSGTTSGNFTNKVREIQNKDKDDNITSTDYKGANLIILGNANIATLKNDESQNGTNSIISIEGGTLESANLTNAGLIQAIRGSLNATNLLNNNGGEIVAYSGGTITANSFTWGNGVVRYINGHSGTLNLNNITITADSKLNMDFSLSPIVFGKEYKVIQTNSSNATNFTITSNVNANLQDSNNLTFTKTYKDGYIVISTEFKNANSPLNSLLSASALQTLGDKTAQFDALKRLDSSEILSHIISNPQKVATELKQSNELVAINHTKNSHLNLANSLNTLNRLNKSATPRKLAFSDILRPNYNFAQRNLNTQKPKNPLIKFANFNESTSESSAESESNETYTLEDLKADYDEQVEAAKLKYNQLIDYNNNLYGSIFGVFGDFGGIETNAYGVLAGYDTKITDTIIIGANLSYAFVSKAHNIGVGSYGRAFLQNSEIDFSLNFNYALNDYKTQMFGYTQSAKFSSFGFSANADYGYLFNVYKSQFFKPFGGLNLYYANTPSYAESGKYGRAIDLQHSFELSIDLGAEYRAFLKRNQYLYAQIRFEQFIANLSNGLNMSFVGDGSKFELAKYKGYKNYLQFLVGGDFAIIKDTLSVTINAGYKMTLAKSRVDSREIDERYISVSAGIKYMF